MLNSSPTNPSRPDTHLMPREARNPAATWAPLPPPQMVTWMGFQPSLEALSRSISAFDVATERVMILLVSCCENYAHFTAVLVSTTMVYSCS